MKVFRNKVFSSSTDENNTEKKSVKVGEALGTAGIGTLASVEGSKLVKKLAKNPIENIESKEAKKEFRSGLSNLMKEKSIKDLAAKNARIKGQSDLGKSLIDVLFHKKRVKDLDDKYIRDLKKNDIIHNIKVKKLKNKIVSSKEARVAKKLSRLGKGTMIAGLAATGLAAGSKLVSKNNKKDK